jgi:flagellar hook-associated protein FlgK
MTVSLPPVIKISDVNNLLPPIIKVNDQIYKVEA